MTSTSNIVDCCGGLTISAPTATFNRASLSSVSMRSGTYWSFHDTMIARLGSSDHGSLNDLKARDPQMDFSIALIDAWSVAGDILTFYNERLANETLVETALETQSLHLLAQLVGYAPHPGVSASVNLAFTLGETGPDAVDLASGIKVQSTPGPGEDPVLFETNESIKARPAWNAMRPRLGTVQSLASTTTKIYLSGNQTGLKSGDGIFFVADDNSPIFAYVHDVTILPSDPVNDPGQPDLTCIKIDTIVTAPLSDTFTVPVAPPLPPFSSTLSGLLGDIVDAGDLTQILAEANINESEIFEPLSAASAAPKRVLVFKASAGTFGKTAPSFDSLPQSLTGTTPVFGTNSDGVVVATGTVNGPYIGRSSATWADVGNLEWLGTLENWVFLDEVVSEVSTGSSVVLVDGDNWGIYRPDDVGETAVSDFAITGKSTRLKMSTAAGFSSLSIRGTTAFLDSEWLDLPLQPREDALRAGEAEIELDGFFPGLQSGSLLSLSGSLADGVDASITEFAEIAAVVHVLYPGSGTFLTLAGGIKQDFDRRTLRMNGNVAPATHGETKFEILGSGSAQIPFPSFAAKQGPLTFVSADVPGGASPEITLRVNGIEWDRVSNLLEAQLEDRHYTLGLDIEGKARLGFGDGFMGALPSTGQDNVTLDYRVGIGLAGRVDAGQLNILMSRPLGLEGVVNPEPSEGGANPETLDDLRSNIPLYCRTMDRAVSLSDYADFARGFAGIAKARAERVKIPGLPSPGIVLTVAGGRSCGSKLRQRPLRKTAQCTD